MNLVRAGEVDLVIAVSQTVSVGIVVVTEDLRVQLWNQWMADASGVPAEQALGRTLDEVFPDMAMRGLRRKIGQVILLGNQAFFDARVHGAVFPLRRASPINGDREFILQGITISRLCLPDGRQVACISVADETAAAQAERQLRRAHEQLEETSRRDGLTGLLNRPAVCGALATALGRAVETTRFPGVILFDIDHFKRINDTWGHLAGDEALRQTGAAISAACRASDPAGRYGGEEFLVVLPGADMAQTLMAARRIQERIRDILFDWEGDDIQITASFGIASAQPGEDVEALLARADAALYEAKAAGRDRICEAA